MGYLPFTTGVLDRIMPWLRPSVFGTYHDRSLPFLLGNVPTVGQGLYISIIVVLNVIFLTIGYKTLYPERVMQWYQNHYQELMAYWMWRTGVLAFCNMPVLFLFSSRNNVLLWLTNWSHSTYMLLHRWVACLFLFQTLLHSILALVLYCNTGSYATSLVTEWWIWGCVATVAAVVLFLTSMLVVRKQAYELFLVTHIIMAVICVVGCWYHVWYGYYNTFGYETWIYATVAVWFFDRLARVGRIINTGIRHAKVTEIGSRLVRVDVGGIRWAKPGQHVYVYFPTLSPMRPWENHPFSMIPTAMINTPKYSDRMRTDLEKPQKSSAVSVRPSDVGDGTPFTTAGLTLFVRKSAGMTRFLQSNEKLLTLLEGPYPNSHTTAVLRSDRLLLIGGGIGITGLLPFTKCHANVKLFHSVKAEDKCLIDSLEPVLDDLCEKDVRVGQRLDIDALIQDESSLGWAKIAVVVCGPAAMCDDVRAVVSHAGKEKVGVCSFELEVDAFSW